MNAWTNTPITPAPDHRDSNRSEWSEHHAKRGGKVAYDAYTYSQRGVGRRLAAGFKLMQGES